MNRKELESSIELLDNSVEKLVEINSSVGGSIVPDYILDNLQSVIARLEHAYRYAEPDVYGDEEDE